MTTRLVSYPGPVYVSVCSDEGPEAAVEWANRLHPTGITPWHLSTNETFSDGEPNPCPCDLEQTFTHYLLNC